LHRKVELALAVVLAADHREDASVSRVEGDERGGRHVRALERVRDRLPRQFLQSEVDRRLDDQPAAEDLARPVPVDELLLDVVDEVLRRPTNSGLVDVLGLRQRRPVRLAVLVVGDVLLVDHRLQHVASALL
jgi:hypothetical protein